MDISEDDLRACVRVLRAIEADRSHLTRLTQEQRRELLTLAGLVAKPERHDLVRMAKAFRRAEREAAKEHDRKAIERAGLRIQRRQRVFTPLWLEPPKPEDLDDRPRLVNGARLLRLQAALCKGTSLLRFHVRALWRLQLRQARAACGPERPVRADYRRASEDRLPGFAQTSARRRACHRHDALSDRCRRPLFERAGRFFVSGAPADPRAGSASHAERRTVHEISCRPAAAPRLHSQQRVPDGASAGGILSTPAGAGSRVDCQSTDRTAMRARGS